MEPIYNTATVGPILYMRHAPTYFNTDDIPKEVAKTKLCYIDCSINSNSRSLLEQASEKLNKLKIKYVFCSPLMRCLETSFHVLKNHPDKDKFSVIVHPYITEGVNSIHDYCRNYQLKKDKYNQTTEVKYDWKIFDEFYPDESQKNLYFLDLIDTSNDSYLNDLIKRIREESTDELFVELSTYFRDRNIRQESLNSIFQRSVKFKSFVKDFIRRNEFNVDKGDKVLVVTHSAMIRISTSFKVNVIDRINVYPDDCYISENCEIISINI